MQHLKGNNMGKIEIKKSIDKLKNNFKLCAFTTSLALVSLTGCGNIDDNVANNDVVQETVSTEVTTEVQTMIEEHPVIEHLNSNKIIIEDFIVSNDAEKIGEKGRAAFIEFADFIFYDQEIEGYKYEELDEETKSKVYSKFCYIDNLVSGYNEDYKDSLEDKYKKVASFTSSGYYAQVDLIKRYANNPQYTAEDIANKIDTSTGLVDYYSDSELTAIIFENGNAVLIDLADYQDSNGTCVLKTSDGREIYASTEKVQIITGADAHQIASNIAESLISENGHISNYENGAVYEKTR